MRNFTKNNVLALVSCAALLFSACGDDSKNAGGSVEDQEIIAISDKTVMGVSQKGPFVNGSSVTVQELNGETLAQTGLGFEGKIKNDMGEFSVKVNKLESQYALLKANGFYRNEVSGEKSKSQVTLYALTDLSKRDEVNVNLLTHLSYERSLYLATEEESVSVAEAKKQAETEVLKSFEIEGDFDDAEDLNIFGESDQSAALLAISVLMQGNLSEGDFSERLANYAADIESDGVWNDTKTATQIADWAFSRSMSGGLALIRNNIANWNLSANVPSFEKYVDNFWWQNYGLGTCETNRDGEVKQNSNAQSLMSSDFFICKENAWRMATALEYDTYEKKCDEDGKIVFGNVNKEQPYDCDGKSWRAATEAEGKLGGCIEKRFNEIAEAFETHYICENREWRLATDIEKDTYEWKDGKDGDVKFGDIVKTNCYVYEDSSWHAIDARNCFLNQSCTSQQENAINRSSDSTDYICRQGKWIIYTETFVDLRDEQEYSSVRIGSQIWMYEDLNYAGPDVNMMTWEKGRNRWYNWNAISSDICPSGWHVPSKNEWQKLIDFFGGPSKSYNVLQSCLDVESEYNFVCNERLIYGDHEWCKNRSDDGDCIGDSLYIAYTSGANYWTLTDVDDAYAYYVWIALPIDADEVMFKTADKRDGAAIRCIKDDE